MDTWQILLVTTLIPALITAGLPFLSSKMKTAHDARVSDAQVGSSLRDELRRENEGLRKRIDDLESRLDREAEDGRECRRDRERLHSEVNQLRHQLMSLEQRVRRGPNSLHRRVA